MLEIYLLGAGQATYKGKRLVGFPNQKPYKLLCILLLNLKKILHREHMAAILWEDYPTESALKYLRNALWRLRKKFFENDCRIEEFLLITDETISFDHNSNYWLDIEEFENSTLPELSLSSEELSNDLASKIGSALELYQGDLLESVYDDWCLYDRERLRLIHHNALFKLMQFYTLKGDYALGLDYGKRLLSLDSTREKVHRQMMWLYLKSGDRGKALQQYKCCKKILREELNLQPMQETHKLYNEIIHFSSETIQIPDLNTYILSDSKENVYPTKQFVHSAIRKLSQLQDMISETSTELHILERMMGHSLNQNE